MVNAIVEAAELSRTGGQDWMGRTQCASSGCLRESLYGTAACMQRAAL